MKYAEDPAEAALKLTIEGDQVHIDQNPDPNLGRYISARFAGSISRNDTKKLQDTIRSWRHFNYHLYRRPTEDAFPQVRMELQYLKPKESDYFMTEYQPIEGNLLQEEPAKVYVANVDDDDSAASEDSLLGMTLHNEGPEPLWPHLFYFDPNDLTITPWFVSAKGTGERVDPPLAPYSKLTLGYGNGGAPPWEFVLTGNRTEDVGFFKLFLSTESANFGCLARRRTHFEQNGPENRLGEQVDKEAKDASVLETKLDSNRWGVKMATVIQIKK
ncbi:hypothetical protein MD484_g7653, partial [Candolleomyces efflorescens]